MALQGGDMTDLIRTTLRKLGRGKITDISSTLQNYPAAKRLITKNKFTEEKGGYEAQFDVMVNSHDSARGVPLGWTADPNITDGIVQGTVPFRHTEFNWSLIRQEIPMNSGPARIVDLIATRRKRAMIGWAKYVENRFWRLTASTNGVDYYGLPNWVVKSATAATKANNDGFNGTVPSGYSTVAGISSTTYPMWRNYSDAYSNVSKDDLIKKMRRCMAKTNFVSPVTTGPGDFNKGDDFAVYSNYDTRGAMIELAESQNENIGKDLAAFEGGVLVNRRPIEYVADLDNDTTNPLYFINWGVFGIIVLEGEWMHETKIEENPHQPSVYTTYTECSFNTTCYDRRALGVISNGTGLPA